MGISIEKFFLYVALVFGLLYVFILPPFQSVDENTHFYRGYEIASGRFIAQKVNHETGDYLPSSLSELSSKYSFLVKNIDAKVKGKYILESGDTKLTPDKVQFTEFANTALYSPVCYLSQIPGMFLAKNLGANPLIIFYFGRISNLIFFILMTYFAIKIIPFGKTTVAILALMPMTLSLGGALTSDVMVIGVNFLWVAFLLKLIFEKENVNNFQICSFILLGFLLALSKHYFMLLPLIFLIPKSQFKNIFKYLSCTLGTILIAASGLFLWQNIISHLGFSMNGEADFSKQLDFIFSNPLSYAFIFLKSFVLKMPRIIITMIGVLGWQDTRLDFLTYIIYPILIILSLGLDKKEDFAFAKWQLYLIGFDVIISVFLIFTNLYLMWTKPALGIIYGLNGKYFIPVMLPFLMLFYNFKSKTSDNLKLFIYAAVILILISSNLSLLHRFYGLTPNLHYQI